MEAKRKREFGRAKKINAKWFAKLGKRGGPRWDDFLGLVFVIFGLLLIGFLVVVLVRAISDQEEKDAKEFLADIGDKLDSVGAGYKGDITMLGIKPSSADEPWYFIQWDKSQESIRPDSCFFKNCYCVCKIKTAGFFANAKQLVDKEIIGTDWKELQNARATEIKKSCEATGYCENVDAALVPGGMTEIGPKLVEFEVNWANPKVLCIYATSQGSGTCADYI